MFYGYIAHRYTAEFLPALVVLSAIGMADATRRWPGWSRRARRAAATGLIVFATFGVVANTAVGAATARVTEGGQSLRNLLSVRRRVSDWSGRPLSGFVDRTPALDEHAPRGSDSRSWATATRCISPRETNTNRGERSTCAGCHCRYAVTGRGTPGRIPLVVFEVAVERSLVLDHDGDGNFRLVVEGGLARAPSPETGTTSNPTPRSR